MAMENTGKTIPTTAWSGTNVPVSQQDHVPYYPGPPPYSAVNNQVQQNPHPIVSQPQLGADLGNWTNISNGVPAWPFGLQYLATIDQFLVQRKHSETCFDVNEKFVVKNHLGQNIFWAIDKTDCCTYYCCEAVRPFDMNVFDIHNKQIIHFHRSIGSSKNSMEVSSPPGHVVARIEEEWTWCLPQFSVKDHMGNTVLGIEGSDTSCCDNNEFNILTVDGTQIGKISKKSTGLLGIFSGSETFGINFPMDLDIRMKAAMLGAYILTVFGND